MDDLKTDNDDAVRFPRFEGSGASSPWNDTPRPPLFTPHPPPPPQAQGSPQGAREELVRKARIKRLETLVQEWLEWTEGDIRARMEHDLAWPKSPGSPANENCNCASSS
jgi:hypothetical protein